MEIIRGKIASAQKIVVYGPEGVGKSTFASKFPNVLFIDTEGSTKKLDVARTPAPSSWNMLLGQIRYVKDNPGLCSTLAIDTADWAEKLCIRHICDKAEVDGLEGWGWGKGYTYLEEEFGRLLNQLTELVEMGITVVLTAHAALRKVDLPDEMGSFDRWEMKLQKKTAPMVKEWVDTIFFANFKTHVINVDGQGAQKGKNKAQGQKRLMYTMHKSCWDAKNRDGLPEELPFEFAQIAHVIPANLPVKTKAPALAPPPEPPTANTAAQQTAEQTIKPDKPDNVIPYPNAGHKAPPEGLEPTAEEFPEFPDKSGQAEVSRALDVLGDLMAANDVSMGEVQAAVASRGYYPKDTPVLNYDPKFINGVLIAAWPQVFQMIQQLRSKAEPF